MEDSSRMTTKFCEKNKVFGYNSIKEIMMSKSVNRRDFIKTSAVVGGLSVLPIRFLGCSQEESADFLTTLPQYDIYPKFKTPQKLVRYNSARLKDSFPGADTKSLSLLNPVLTIFQGLINRKETRLWLDLGSPSVDWLAIYRQDGYHIPEEEETDFASLIRRYAPELDGYIIFDPDMLHSLNVAQTWGSLENWMVIPPDLETLIKSTGLVLKEDLRNRWPGRVPAYEWAFENLFPRCSKHLIANYCVDYPGGVAYVDRDFSTAGKAFIMDLSAAVRQRKEYRLMNKIYAQMETPGAVWGWHCTRDHEHWAVERSSRKGLYTICTGMPNLSVHGGIKPKESSIPKQKKSPRQDLSAQKNKIYISFLMTDGDSMWVMNSLQRENWMPEKKRAFPVSWGFLPLLADIAPAVYKHYIRTQQPDDYMFAGPAGAGYTYSYMHPDPPAFLRYSKFYMERCGLNMAYITNWNDYTNWQEVDVPSFNDILFKELDNCIGYVRGMGESAFEPNYNFKDKPFVFCGEGLHMPDKDDVATVRNFIEANPNRPLFIALLANISIPTERMHKITTALKDYPIEYVRLDDLIYLIKSAYSQGLITEDLYPNREGNEKILSMEAAEKWPGAKASFEKLTPILTAQTKSEGLARMNTKEAGLALGQRITEEDSADILAFALSESMFSLVKTLLNYKGIYVNKRVDAVNQFVTMFSKWDDVSALSILIHNWQHWDELTFKWDEIVSLGRKLANVYKQADGVFK